jgi:hypothetical protein
MMVFLFGRNSARIMPLPSQQTVAMIFFADNICCDIFGFGDPVRRHCNDCRLLSGVMFAIEVSSQ